MILIEENRTKMEKDMKKKMRKSKGFNKFTTVRTQMKIVF